MKRGVCKNILFNHAMKLIKDKKVIVIDVREKNESSCNQTLEGSINIPISELVKRIREVVPNREQPILVYCATGSRSIFACQILADFGYTMVYNLQGGIR